jgi:alpha-L-fucosidase
MPFDKYRQSQHQPVYHEKPKKIEARKQLVQAYRDITGNQSIPLDRNYWTLCNRQPNSEGAEIVQLVNMGFLKKDQFCGVDYDVYEEGVIEKNRQDHPEAHWFKGDWLEMISENYDQFKPSLVYFDYTRAVITPASHLYVARTMNFCPDETVVAANVMISDGRSNRKFDPQSFLGYLMPYLRKPSSWGVYDHFYTYKASKTEMATYFFYNG